LVGLLGMTVTGWCGETDRHPLAFAVAMAAAVADAVAVGRLCPVGLGARERHYGPGAPVGIGRLIAGNVGAGSCWSACAGHLMADRIGALGLVVAARAWTRSTRARGRCRLWPAARPDLLRNPAFLPWCSLEHGAGQPRLLYGFSAVQWRAEARRPADRAVWGLGVLAEIVLFGCRRRLPKSLRQRRCWRSGGVGAVVAGPPCVRYPGARCRRCSSCTRLVRAAHLAMMGFLARADARELAATAQGFAATGGDRQRLGDLRLRFRLCGTGSLAYLAEAAMALSRPDQRALCRTAVTGAYSSIQFL